MNVLDIMKSPTAYASGFENTPVNEQRHAKRLCWEYNQTSPDEQEKRRKILQELLGTCHPMTAIEPSFHCDYGFNIHTYGLAVINYNCVILDTSPVHIGAGAFIAPGVCMACSGHSIDPEQRGHGIGTSAPSIGSRTFWQYWLTRLEFTCSALNRISSLEYIMLRRFFRLWRLWLAAST